MKSKYAPFRRIAAFALLSLLGCGATGCAGAAAEEPWIETPQPRRSLEWGGMTWSVRGSEEAVGPLANYFSSRPETVFADSEGRLHLRIRPENGIWRASEVVLKRKFGYGVYEWRIESPLADLDPECVIGLFTWSDNARYANREIDIEFSAWGDGTRAEQGQYVVQPYDIPGNMKTFSLGSAIGPTSHRFVWLPDRIEFLSWTGYGPAPAPAPAADLSAEAAAAQAPGRGLDKPGRLLAAFVFSDATKIPKPGNEYVHINFYLMEGGKPPARGKALELVLSSFSFAPRGSR
jgi:hypothetical protein